MTVKELIEILQEYNNDLIVLKSTKGKIVNLTHDEIRRRTVSGDRIYKYENVGEGFGALIIGR